MSIPAPEKMPLNSVTRSANTLCDLCGDHQPHTYLLNRGPQSLLYRWTWVCSECAGRDPEVAMMLLREVG